MPFLALRFDADADLVERWSDALLEAGALSVDVADPDAGTAAEQALFDEPGAAAAPRWRRSRMTVLFAGDLGEERAVALAAAALGGPLPPHATEVVPDTDWVRSTQAQFGPIQVGAGLWVLPSWCEAVDASAINVLIDPGLAFGTGSHPTTRLCLRWLAEHPPCGASVLDYGCGSGVLAIAAAKLGARSVCGVDVDGEAITASRANAAANAVTASFGSPEELAQGAFDLALANILAGPLELLAPVVARRVREGGDLILSGVLEAQCDAVAAAYSRWFNIGAWAREDGWVALAGRRFAS